MNRRIRRHTAVAFAFAAMAWLIACGAGPGHSGPSATTTATAKLSYPYTFKYFIDDGTTRTLVNVVPAEVASAARAQPGGSNPKSTNARGLHTLDITVPTNDPADPLVVTGPDDLLGAAAAECGMVGDNGNTILANQPNNPAYADVVSMEQNGQVTPSLVFVPPWTVGTVLSNQPTNYYIFSEVPKTCDNVLEYTETLVCIADKLTELADTVAPLTWHAPAFEQFNGGSLATGNVSWIIPPPAEDTKFIVRDIAMDVLAHVPILDSFNFVGPLTAATDGSGTEFQASLGHSCAQEYANYASDGDPSHEIPLFGVSPIPPGWVSYPPNPATVGSSRTLVGERQAFEAGNLRAAGQLLHDIIRDSVYSDLAGAAAVGEATGDQHGGQVASFDLASNQPYNSLGHVARTLLGRWDMALAGSTTPVPGVTTSNQLSPFTIERDPQCHAVTELGLLPALADPGTIARANDLGALTGNQALAETLFEESGLVITDGATVTLSTTLLDQLLAIKASTLGTDPTTLSTQPTGMALSNLVGTLAPSDLARGVQHNQTTFSIITNSPTNLTATSLTTVAQAAGLTPWPSTMPQNAALGTSGIAILGGLPRSLAQTDPVARSGPMMVASQCAETVLPINDSLSALLASPTAEPPAVFNYPNPNPSGNFTTGSAAVSANMPAAWVRQDVFAVGDAIRAELVELRQFADGGLATTSTSSVDAQARAAAIAELGAWAGGGRAILGTSAQDGFNSAPPSQVILYLAGVNPADFGGQLPTPTSGQISLVYNDPHLAECAAHLTTSNCSASAVQAAQWFPTTDPPAFELFPFLTPAQISTRIATGYGMTGGFVTLPFDVSAAPANLVTNIANQAGTGWGFQNPFYIVLSQDPSKPPGKGEILGAIALAPALSSAGGTPSTSLGTMSLALAPMRRELLYDAFGLGKWVGAAPPQAGELPSSGTPSFCVEGVSRDIFVPLQNDLTDSSDSYENSWSHYLSLAQEAAVNADTLAQQLVDIGFQQTTTVENAAEQYLNQSGNILDTSQLTIDSNGNINPGSDNGSLASILSPATFDAVFLGAGPAPSLAVSDLTTSLNCVTYPGNGVCQKLAQPGATVAYVPYSGASTWAGPASPTTVTYTTLNLKVSSANPQPLKCPGVTAQALALKGLKSDGTAGPAAFDNGTFTSAVANLDEGSILGAIGTTNMIIYDGSTELQPPGRWQVTYAGAVIMDSDDPASWPGCLSASSSTPCPFATNPTMAAYNDLFRWCPGVDGRTAALGACDGNADAELNAIRWRVEGALWLAAAMSGDIPQGMFAGPTPAVNFPPPCSGSPAPPGCTNSPGSFTAPGNMVFGTGTFSTLNGLENPAILSSAYGQPAPSEEGNLGTAFAVDPASRFFNWGVGGAQQLPPWLLTVYAPVSSYPASAGANFNTGDGTATNPYVHVMASTLEGPSDYGNINGFLANPAIGISISNQLQPAAWGNVASLIDKLTCNGPVGNGSSVPASGTPAAQLQGLVGALKTQHLASGDMSLPFSTLNLSTNIGGLLVGGELAVSDFWNGSNAFLAGARTTSGSTSLNSQLNPAVLFTQPPTYYWLAELAVPLLATANNSGVSGLQAADYRDPGVISPGARLTFALNSGAPNGRCDAAWQLTQAMALSCILSQDTAQNLPSAPALPIQVKTLSDLTALSAYVRNQLSQSAGTLKNAFVAGVPAIVVANAMNVPGTLTTSSGTVGKDLAQASNSLLSIFSDWNNIQMYGESISNAIEATRTAIARAETQADQGALNLDIQNLGAMKAIAQDTASIWSAIGQTITGDFDYDIGGVIAGAANGNAAETSFDLDTQLLPLISQLQTDNGQILTDNINDAINTLNQSVNINGTAMVTGLSTLRQDVNNVSAGTAALATDRATATYYAGKASGADVWNCSGANTPSVECVSHVNTVLNRRYDGTELRYASALKNAKGLAYLARLSIEQRLGIRLSDISTPIGTLDPPATWADDVCHLTGVNYQDLANELPDGGSSAAQMSIDQTVASEFADAFIGDYVQKLTDFVQYYNVTYPEQDGNDTAVLSLRESLLGGNASCQTPSTNLLLDASRLYDVQGVVDGGVATGWARNACSTSDANCLEIEPLAGLAPPTLPGNVSWLADVAPPNPGDSGVDSGAVLLNANAIAGGPDDVVSQQVLINTPGTYVLSWWDQAVDPSGRPATGSPPSFTPTAAYQARVYDSTWTTVGGFAGVPTAGGWSARHVVTFTVATPDVYHVAFGASAVNTSPGSVAIANVQLELATSSGGPTAYVDTSSSGLMTAYACAVSPAQMRAAFTHNCDPDGTCHYDLNTPIAINTQTMTANGMSLAGKIAGGNYNFRHIDVAMNVVGTGVIDCTSTGSPDCYGSGFLQYTLTDDGSNVGVLGFDGQYRNFDFGTATISQAKAVTAERYITTPVGSDDQALVSQFLQTQFRGRPIDGIYTLRIYDTPALQFNQLQDVQIILNYHYWSKVVTAANSN